MGSGCTCAANAVVRALLRHLIVESDEFVILDMEAGVEHIGRATARNVDIMLVVADASMKALETAKHISALAEAAPMKHVFLVGNKVADKSQRNAIEQYAKRNHLSVLHYVPFDNEVIKAEIGGETPLNDRDSEAVMAIEELASKLTMQEG
jgi:CO dehydrogenase maturation factor